MGIFNMVGGGGGGGYKTYNELKAMSLSDALTELNTDAQGYYDNLNGNIRIYNNCFIGNDSNDGECKRNGVSIIFYNGEWSSIDTSNIDTESIIIVIMTDSNGGLKIPVAGRNHSTTQNAPYNWKVSYDGGNETVYSGTGSASSIAIASGLTANTTHIIIIKPVIEDYGWALSFGFQSSGIESLLQSIIYDGSYKGYGVSSTDAGNYFRDSQYNGCTNLTTAPQEVLPSGVTNIGLSFRSSQYNGCISLTTASSEVLPSGVTRIPNNFRKSQYNGCTNLTTAPQEALPNTVTNIGNSFRSSQYNGCISLTTTSQEVLTSGVTNIGNNFRNSQYYGCTNLTTAPQEALPNTVTSIGNYFRSSQYNGCTNLTTVEGLIDLDIGNSSYRSSQFATCTSNKTVKVLSDVGYAGQSSTLDNSYVTEVQVPSAYLNNFINSTKYPRKNITDSKFVGY